MRQTVTADEVDLASQASACIALLLQKYRKEPLLLLSSGGSALGLLDLLPSDALSSSLTLGLVDERYRGESNERKLLESVFWERARAARVSLLSYDMHGSLVEAARQYEAELRAWKGKTLVILGIGEDAHTAGIAPFPQDPKRFSSLFEQKDVWVVGYNTEGRLAFPLRLTVTLSFLREVPTEAVVFASGEAKREAVAKTLAKTTVCHEAPACVIHAMKRVHMFYTSSSCKDPQAESF